MLIGGIVAVVAGGVIYGFNLYQVGIRKYMTCNDLGLGGMCLLMVIGGVGAIISGMHLI